MNNHSVIHTIAPEIISTVILLVGAVLVNFAITAILRTRIEQDILNLYLAERGKSGAVEQV